MENGQGRRKKSKTYTKRSNCRRCWRWYPKFLFDGFHSLNNSFFVIINIVVLTIMKIKGLLDFYYLSGNFIHALKKLFFRWKKLRFFVKLLSNDSLNFGNIILGKHIFILHREKLGVNPDWIGINTKMLTLGMRVSERQVGYLRS